MGTVPLRRFADVYSPEAKAYGAGAFAWVDKHWLAFRHPSRPRPHWPLDPENVDVSSVPVSPQENGWSWNSDRDNPVLSPSIAIRSRWGEGGEEVELWHGYIRGGCLETLEE